MPSTPLFFILLFFLGHTWPTHAQNCGDCVTAFPLCDKTFLHFNVAEGIGHFADAAIVPCFLQGENMGQAEENSTWIYFRIQVAGQLFFTITPDASEDDLDFVLFQLPADGNCDQKKVLRCMAAGDREKAPRSPCMGQTGLRPREEDTVQDPGCSERDDNNWLKPLDAEAGGLYVLLVSNVTAPRGFTIQFKGSALLEPCVVAGEKKE